MDSQITNRIRNTGTKGVKTTAAKYIPNAIRIKYIIDIFPSFLNYISFSTFYYSLYK